MKLGGRCPLNKIKDQESYIKTELENFYGVPLEKLNIINGNLKKEFCKNICKNILC